MIQGKTERIQSDYARHGQEDKDDHERVYKLPNQHEHYIGTF